MTAKKRSGERSPADVALEYVGRGWTPVAIPQGSKGPRNKDWPHLEISEATVKKHFPAGSNIGIQMGRCSGGLADVDLDCPEAMLLAPSLLPETGAIFGRQSKPRSHYLYTGTGDIEPKAAIQFKDAQGGMLVEFRIGGGEKAAQTMAPGSVHPSGEAVRWDSDSAPAEMPYALLKAAVMKLAVAIMLLRGYPKEGIGARHEAALRLGGFLARVSWDAETIMDFVETLAEAAKDAEVTDRRRAAGDAAEAHARGEASFGMPALAEYFGEDTVKQIAKWFRYREKAAPSYGQPGASTEYQRTATGVPLMNLFNVMVTLRSDDAVRDSFAFDEMERAVIVQRPLPGQVAIGSYPRPAIDEDTSALQHWLQGYGLRNVGRDVVHEAINLRAGEQSFHPVRDRLDGLRWDRKRRLYDFLPTYFGAENTFYTRTIGRLFLIQMVARIYEPGCKADYMLIIEGDQGKLKSSACEALAGQWFSDQLPDLSHKDSSQHLRGKWLIEIAELHTFKRTEVNLLKGYLARRVERYRPSYGRREVVEPRQTVFIGSSNSDQYLGDVTGGRRFWPFKAHKIDLAAIRRDRDQLFAEAVELYLVGVWWWPTRDFERDYARKEQDARYDADAWEVPILQYLNLQVKAKRRAVLVNEVAKNALGFHSDGQIGTTDHIRIKKVLQRLKWVRDQKKDRRGLFPYRPGPGWTDPPDDDADETGAAGGKATQPRLKLVGSDDAAM